MTALVNVLSVLLGASILATPVVVGICLLLARRRTLRPRLRLVLPLTALWFAASLAAIGAFNVVNAIARQRSIAAGRTTFELTPQLALIPASLVVVQWALSLLLIRSARPKSRAA
jgi:hypothetical protein